MALSIVTSLLGMLPLLAIGLNYYRYQQIDPETKVQEPQTVSVYNNNKYILINDCIL